MLVTIGIAGNADAGKSTVRKALLRSLKNAHHFAFGDEVKRTAREEFGWDGKKDERGRRLLQVIATEGGREYNSEIWVDKLQQIITTAYYASVNDYQEANPGVAGWKCSACGAIGKDDDPVGLNICCDEAKIEFNVPLFIAVVDDCRFVNEHNMIQNYQVGVGFTVLVEHDGSRSKMTEATAAHTSENSRPARSTYDITLQNDAMLEEEFMRVAYDTIRKVLLEKGIEL